MRTMFVITFGIVTASPVIAQTKSKTVTPVQSSTDNSGPRNEDPNWERAWTNIVPANRTGQSFIVKSHIFSTVEVALLEHGNKTADKDTIVVTVYAVTKRGWRQSSDTSI